MVQVYNEPLIKILRVGFGQFSLWHFKKRMSNFSETELTYAWLETLFSPDPQVPGQKVTNPENLELAPGVTQTQMEDEERETVYNFKNIQNAYRVLFICSLANSPTHTESLLHAHAETFLKKAYAAWNLSGIPRLRFEQALGVYVNTTLAQMFQTNAPVCREGTNEILALQDMHQELEDSRVTIAELKARVGFYSKEVEMLQEKLKEAELRDINFAQNLSESIDGAVVEQRQKYEFLSKNVDSVIAAAVQDTKQQLDGERGQLYKCQSEFTFMQGQLKIAQETSQERLVLLEKAAAEMMKMQDRLRSCGQIEKSECCIH